MASNILTSIDPANGTLTISVDGNANGNYESITTFSLLTGALLTETIDPDDNPATNNSVTTTLCFMEGTRILTSNGELAIESLQPGDLVICADGRALPVRWLGVQTVSKTFADPDRAMPILIKAGALEDGVPSRDLLVSPSHALYLQGVLVHASALVNGQTITRFTDTPEIFRFYNVELPEHAVIFAEGAPAESFVDNASREHFDNWAERADDAEPIAELPYARAKSARQVPASVRNALIERAADSMDGIRSAA